MKSEKLKQEDLSILDGELKYIYKELVKSKNVNETKKTLAKKLNSSVKTITTKFIEASYMVQNKIEENKEKELQSYVRKCIKNDLIQLSEIANYYQIDEEDLKAAFINYISSFTDDESKIADNHPWSEEALKKGNIQTLLYRVNGFSKHPKYPEQVVYRFVREQDIQFLKSVKDIYNEYRVDDILKIKTYKK